MNKAISPLPKFCILKTLERELEGVLSDAELRNLAEEILEELYVEIRAKIPKHHIPAMAFNRGQWWFASLHGPSINDP